MTQEPPQIPVSSPTYRKVRKLRRPGLRHRIRSFWKRISYRRKRLLIRILIGIGVSLTAILLAALIVALT